MVLRAPAALSVTILRPADAADLTLEHFNPVGNSEDAVVYCMPRRLVYRGCTYEMISSGDADLEIKPDDKVMELFQCTHHGRSLMVLRIDDGAGGVFQILSEKVVLANNNNNQQKKSKHALIFEQNSLSLQESRKNLAGEMERINALFSSFHAQVQGTRLSSTGFNHKQRVVVEGSGAKKSKKIFLSAATPTFSSRKRSKASDDDE